MKHILRAILSLLLVVYLVFATSIANRMAKDDVCTGMTIVVNDTTANPFVTSRELARELHGLLDRAPGMRMTDIDTDSIRAMLSRIDKIEDVSVVRYTDGRIVITVDPMNPVARIFDGERSYYINREGKRISADARYHIDVPVIEGHFTDSVFPATAVMPVLEYLENNEKWNSIVSMIKVNSPHDVMLVPAVRGQVINLGAPDRETLDDKFSRLDRFYTDIVPVKGWNYYDTISVKWNKQVVATRRDKQLPETGYIVEEEDDDVDITTMLAADGVAPGQALPNKKAKNDKPIPAANPVKAPKAAADSAKATAAKTTEKSKDTSPNNKKQTP